MNNIANKAPSISVKNIYKSSSFDSPFNPIGIKNVGKTDKMKSIDFTIVQPMNPSGIIHRYAFDVIIVGMSSIKYNGTAIKSVNPIV